MLAEIEDLKNTLMPVIWVFAITFVFLMAFKIRQEQILGINIFLPIPAIDSISLSIFNKVQHDLLPKDIKILIIDPIHALLVQINISMFFAFLISLPILLYRIVSYLKPALHNHEKRIVVTFIAPCALLFLLGSVFGYFFLVPSIFRLLNSYTIVLNAVTYYEINKFISFVILFTFLSGVAFTLPVFMKLSIRFGVNKKFWLKNLKYALILIVTIAFVLAPDLTTMFLVSVVLLSLYALGYYLS